MHRLLFLGSIGLSEWLIILIVVLVLFGGTRIPKLAKDLGSGIREFRKALSGQPEDLTDQRPPEALPKPEPQQTTQPARQPAAKRKRRSS
ncbi:MAG: twin-arginine translocase TatA/TatE family subunit [Spirochaetia bacterium]|nr:twin-arginine translocase TatA/TatE family subunit [Spirochaetia bacterium]